MRVPFLDLRVTDPELRDAMLRAVARVLDHGRVLLGPEVEAFEEALARYCGTKHAVGVGSGSIAIFFALRALGIGPGDEVITSALSFIGTANGVSLAGAKPVFVDVRPDLTIDPALAERAITPATRAIMPVHFTGRLCDMEALAEIAARRGLRLVEDAAPAIGASRGGRKAGAFGAAGCLSINPMKLLNALGEAGAVLTDDPVVRDNVIALRYNGLINREYCHFVSTNGRLDTLQAAVLLERLKRLEGVIERRRRIAAYYADRLSGCVEVPREDPGARDVYYTYTIQCEGRDELAAHLARHEIETKIQHPLLMPEHPAYGGSGAGFPVARRATQRLLCIPAHENMTDAQAEHVAARVREFYAGKS
jgi:dTDP-4-amino-4,6-dideoxygalactose transaminase